MVDTITYRTTDDTRWGGGQGSDLSASQIDTNFWVLWSLLTAISDHTANIADIDYFNVVGNQMYVHLTNHVVLGPYTLPTSEPAGGSTAQRLVKNSDTDYDYGWATDYRNLALFIQDKPAASELLLRYEATEDMFLPASLVGSVASCDTEPTADVSYGIYKNGSSVGSIDFAAGHSEATFTFAGGVALVASDILTIVGPGTPDATQADISFTLQAALVG